MARAVLGPRAERALVEARGDGLELDVVDVALGLVVVVVVVLELLLDDGRGRRGGRRGGAVALLSLLRSQRLLLLVAAEARGRRLAARATIGARRLALAAAGARGLGADGRRAPRLGAAGLVLARRPLAGRLERGPRALDGRVVDVARRLGAAAAAPAELLLEVRARRPGIRRRPLVVVRRRPPLLRRDLEGWWSECLRVRCVSRGGRRARVVARRGPRVGRGARACRLKPSDGDLTRRPSGPKPRSTLIEWMPLIGRDDMVVSGNLVSGNCSQPEVHELGLAPGYRRCAGFPGVRAARKAPRAGFFRSSTCSSTRQSTKTLLAGSTRLVASRTDAGRATPSGVSSTLQRASSGSPHVGLGLQQR